MRVRSAREGFSGEAGPLWQERNFQVTGLFINRLRNRLFQVNSYYLVTVIIFNHLATAAWLLNHSTTTILEPPSGYGYARARRCVAARRLAACTTRCPAGANSSAAPDRQQAPVRPSYSRTRHASPHPRGDPCSPRGLAAGAARSATAAGEATKPWKRPLHCVLKSAAAAISARSLGCSFMHASAATPATTCVPALRGTMTYAAPVSRFLHARAAAACAAQLRCAPPAHRRRASGRAARLRRSAPRVIIINQKCNRFHAAGAVDNHNQ